MAQISPGTYACRTKASYLIPPKEHGTGAQYQLAVTVDVDVPNEAGGVDVVEWTYYASFSDNSYPTFIEKMVKDFGWDPAENGYAFDQLDAGEQSPIAGKEGQAVFQPDTFEGQTKIKLRFLNGPRRAFVPKERMSPTDAKRFAADMRAKLVARAGQQGVRTAPARAPARAPAAAGLPQSHDEAIRRAATTEVFPGEFDDFPNA